VPEASITEKVEISNPNQTCAYHKHILKSIHTYYIYHKNEIGKLPIRICPYWKTISHEFYGRDMCIFNGNDRRIS